MANSPSAAFFFFLDTCLETWVDSPSFRSTVPSEFSPPSDESELSSSGLSGPISCASSSLAAISCWLAPAAISWAAMVMTLLLVLLLENRSVAATIPVKNAVAVCSSSTGLSVFSASDTDTSISAKLLAFGSFQSICPSSLAFSPQLSVATVASCKILPWAARALSKLSWSFTPRASTNSTL